MKRRLGGSLYRNAGRGTALSILLLLPACDRAGQTDRHEAPAHELASGRAGRTELLAGAQYPDSVLEPLRNARGSYDELRRRLSEDSMDGLEPMARQLDQSLASALSALGADPGPTLERLIDEARRAASSLMLAGDLESARAAFGKVSRSLIGVVAADRRLIEGWQTYSCSMTPTFPEWMQPGGELENPYMGSAMLSCGREADGPVPGPELLQEIEAHAEQVHGADGEEIAHYTCSMHPSVERDRPGTCPICSMDLVPVTAREVATGVFVVDAARRQEIGVRTEVARVERLRLPLRAVGRVVYDESRRSEVTVKYRGWVGRLEVDRTGGWISKGQVLFELYSPELYATQEELLAALESQRTARGTAVPDRADYLVDAARQRLRLWDLSEAQIAEVVATGEPTRDLPVLAPASGHVIEKHIVEGSTVEPGQVLYRVAGLDPVWIEAQVHESELPLVEIGQQAEVTLPYLPGRRLAGAVALVLPFLEGGTRTGTVRLTLANPKLELKPEMYADVTLVVERGERLTVADEAVLYAGDRRLVFVDLGEGRLQPRPVEVGIRAGERIEILSGLEAGEIVVTSGNFLIAAESRLKSATGTW